MSRGAQTTLMQGDVAISPDTPLRKDAMQASPLAVFDELLTEAEVCERFVHLLSDRELREARRKNVIQFITGKKGQISYHPDWIADYLKRKITTCLRPRDESGSTGVTGSAGSLVPITSMAVGGTNEHDAHAAEVLTRKFLPKLKSA
jgi:hypothetical protein